MGLFGSTPDIDELRRKQDVKGLVRALRHKDPKVRASAIKPLGERCEMVVHTIASSEQRRDKLQIKPLIVQWAEESGLEDPKERALQRAAVAWDKLGSQAFRGILDALRDSDPEVRQMACLAALALVGVASKHTVTESALLAQLTERDRQNLSAVQKEFPAT